MPRYRVLELSYFNDRIVQAGEEINYDGNPGNNLEPLDEEAAAARAKVLADEPERIRKLLAAAAPEKASMAEEISKGIAEAIATIFPDGIASPAKAKGKADAVVP